MWTGSSLMESICNRAATSKALNHRSADCWHVVGSFPLTSNRSAEEALITVRGSSTISPIPPNCLDTTSPTANRPKCSLPGAEMVVGEKEFKVDGVQWWDGWIFVAAEPS